MSASAKTAVPVDKRALIERIHTQRDEWLHVDRIEARLDEADSTANAGVFPRSQTMRVVLEHPAWVAGATLAVLVFGPARVLRASSFVTGLVLRHWLTRLL